MSEQFHADAEEQLRRICIEQRALIAKLEAKVREYELRDWSVKNRPAVAAVPFKGRG